MNLRPSGYEPDELPYCSTPRYGIFDCLIIISLPYIYVKQKFYFFIINPLSCNRDSTDQNKARDPPWSSVMLLIYYIRHGTKIYPPRKVIKNNHPIGWLLLYVGIFLFSRIVTNQVSSAPLSLTSVFGMGTGGPSTSSTPTHLIVAVLYDLIIISPVP